MSRARFNLNEYVYVRLTPHALAHIKSLHKPEYWPHVKPKVDEQGYSKIQMWKFIDYFGHLFGVMGRDFTPWFVDGLDVQFSRNALKPVSGQEPLSDSDARPKPDYTNIFGEE